MIKLTTLLDFLSSVEKYEIPEFFPGLSGVDIIKRYEARNTCINRGMWAIVDLNWTKALAARLGNLRVLEVMAGAGWLAGALRQHGVDLVATDSGAWDQAYKNMRLISPVEKIDALQAVNKYKADVLLVSWPPYGEQEIVEVVKAWGPGRPIIYIGESDGGCNAPSEFWMIYDSKVLPLRMPQWDGIHDYIFEGYYQP